MPVKIGYARVSTQDQNLSLQCDELTRAGCSAIYQEQVSGTKSDRSELGQCLKALRPGDTLVVWRLDRLGRSLKHLVETVTELEAKGIHFHSLTENIETGSATGKLMFHVFASMAEFERNLIAERTKAGLAAARARGRVGGRPQKLTEADKKLAKKMLASRDITVSEVASKFGVSKMTLYRSVGVVQPTEKQ